MGRKPRRTLGNTNPNPKNIDNRQKQMKMGKRGAQKMAWELGGRI